MRTFSNCSHQKDNLPCHSFKSVPLGPFPGSLSLLPPTSCEEKLFIVRSPRAVALSTCASSVLLSRYDSWTIGHPLDIWTAPGHLDISWTFGQSPGHLTSPGHFLCPCFQVRPPGRLHQRACREVELNSGQPGEWRQCKSDLDILSLIAGGGHSSAGGQTANGVSGVRLFLT